MAGFSLAVVALLIATSTSHGQSYVISTFAGGVPPPTPAAGIGASIGSVSSVATDSTGNVYFGTSLACAFKLDGNGILARVAGTGRPGFSGDGGPATAAQLGVGTPGVAIDSAGNLYIADGGNQRIRRITPDGIITTVASNIFSYRVAVDSGGNLYIPDGDNIRKVASDGSTATIADQIGFPYGLGGLAVDSAANIYVADTYRDRVRRVSASGVITTVASDGGFDGSGAFIQGLFPEDVAIDLAGNLYIADRDNNSIFEVSPAGTVTTVSGQGFLLMGYSGDGGPAVNAKLNDPEGVAADSAGNVYIADRGNNRVRSVSVSGIITTIAGNGSASYSGDGGPASQAQLGGPSGSAFDSAGNLYFADLKNDRVRKISPGGTITTVAGNGVQGYSGDGGPAAIAQLNLSSVSRASVAVDPAGNLYVADAGNRRIRKVSPDGIITTVIATSSPDVAADSLGNIYIADSSVSKVSPDGTIATVVQQGGGPLALDSAGNLYFYNVDFFSGGGVRKISPDGVITTVADPSAVACPVAFAPDSGGSLYVASFCEGFGRVYKILPAKGILPNGILPSSALITIAGTGNVLGYSGDSGPASSAQLAPSGLAIDASGNIYVTDSTSNAIRVLRPAGP